MPLTMTPARFLEIKAEMERRRLVAKAAEIVAATDWDKQPRFSEVDAFLAHLDNLPATDDRLPRSRRKRR